MQHQHDTEVLASVRQIPLLNPFISHLLQSSAYFANLRTLKKICFSSKLESLILWPFFRHHGRRLEPAAEVSRRVVRPRPRQGRKGLDGLCGPETHQGHREHGRAQAVLHLLHGKNRAVTSLEIFLKMYFMDKSSLIKSRLTKQSLDFKGLCGTCAL